jgi:glycosyltransferase involved in cell wall biosynthesis
MRILWLSSLVFGYDTVISRTEMIKHLSQLNVEAYLFAVSSRINHKEKSDKYFILFPMKFIPIITQLLYNLALFFSIPFYIIKKKADFIIIDQGTAIIGFILKIILPKAKFKVVLDIRSTPLKSWRQGEKADFSEKSNVLLFSLSLILAKKFDGITIVTELMKKEVCNRFSINPNFVGVWTSGVSASIFNPRNYNGEKIKKSLGLSRKFVIFYHGSLRPHGLIETFKALKLLSNKQQDLILFLLSNRPTFVSFWIELANELGIPNNVIFRGKVPYADVPKYIAMSDLPIVPLPNSSNWRNQSPLKLLEYLAMEKVVVLTDIPAHREILGKSKNGIYISSTDPKEIAEAIAYAYRNRENLSKWGTFGRAIIQDRYTWEKIAKEFKNYLLRL